MIQERMLDLQGRSTRAGGAANKPSANERFQEGPHEGSAARVAPRNSRRDLNTHQIPNGASARGETGMGSVISSFDMCML